MAETGLHETREALNPTTIDLHRALLSLREELEAVDWYRQRADACDDEELREILLHNMREEIEHATMIMEWLRRRHSDFGEKFGTYLFTTEAITAVEEKVEGREPGEGQTGNKRETLTVGKLKGD